MAHKARHVRKPSWREDGASYRHKLDQMPTRSIVQIHRGAMRIILELAEEVEMAEDAINDIRYSTTLARDVISELELRSKNKEQPCRSKPGRSKTSTKTRRTPASTTSGTSKQSGKASKPSANRSRSSSTKKAKSSQGTGRSKQRGNSGGKRSRRS